MIVGNCCRPERNVSAEGNSGARSGASAGHDPGDPGATRRRKGHGEESAGAAPGVPGHGGVGPSSGGAAGRYREPRAESQFVREERGPAAGQCQVLPEEHPQVDLLSHHTVAGDCVDRHPQPEALELGRRRRRRRQ